MVADRTRHNSLPLPLLQILRNDKGKTRLKTEEIYLAYDMRKKYSFNDEATDIFRLLHQLTLR